MRPEQVAAVALEGRLARIETLLTEVHRDVVLGKVPERVAANEARISTLEREVTPNWRHRAMTTTLQAGLAIFAGFLGVHLPQV